MKFLKIGTEKKLCEEILTLEAVGRDSDNYIVLDGTKKFMISSFEVFKSNNSFYYIDPEENVSRMLCSTSVGFEQFSKVDENFSEFIRKLLGSWNYVSVQKKRILLNSLFLLFNKILLVILAVGLFLINFSLVSKAIAPMNISDESRRDSVYLAINRELDSSNKINLKRPNLVPAEKIKFKKRNMLQVCKRKKIDKDVQKFMSLESFKKVGKIKCNTL